MLRTFLGYCLAASPRPSQDLRLSVPFAPRRRTSSPAVKETSMTELENTAEAAGAQPTPAETDKPEVHLQT